MSVKRIYQMLGHKYMASVTSREEYLRLRSTSKQKELVRRARLGDADSKSKLQQFNYSCLPANESGLLKGATQCSNSVAMDIDLDKDAPDYEDLVQQIRDRILAKKIELGLLLLERSVNKGFHIVFRRRGEMSQEENLRWASDLIQTPYDEAAKDITRVLYATTADPEDLLYLSDELFSEEPVEISDQTTSDSSEPAKSEEKAEEESTDSIEDLSEESQKVPSFRGIPYSEIIKKYWELFHEGKEPIKSERNTLTYELAVNLRHICGFSEKLLDQVIPNYDGFPEKEKLQVIKSALNETRKGMPLRIKTILRALKEDRAFKTMGGTRQTPPAMPSKLPPCLKLMTRNEVDYLKPCVAESTFPALGAHVHGTHFRYIDNKLHEATLMNLLIAPQSSGKSNVNPILDCIMADIVARDTLNRQRENTYKENNPSGKAKRDPRPKDICIQKIANNVTDAAFNLRLDDANRNGGYFLYMCLDELEGLKKITSSGKISEMTEIIRNAFDTAPHGQERVSADSVTSMAPLRLNLNISTTPPNAQKILKGGVSDGTVSRLSLSTIPTTISDTGENNIAKGGEYDVAFKEELKPYIDRLNAISGEPFCPELNRLMKDYVKGINYRAELWENKETYRTLSRRACVIGFLKGMLLYIMEGGKWMKSIGDYVIWSIQYDLWCKLTFFGNQMEQEIREQYAAMNAGPKNVLIALPNEFTQEDYDQMRFQLGLTGDGKSTMRSWKSRGYVEYDDTIQSYVKTEKYKKLKVGA